MEKPKREGAKHAHARSRRSAGLIPNVHHPNPGLCVSVSSMNSNSRALSHECRCRKIERWLRAQGRILVAVAVILGVRLSTICRCPWGCIPSQMPSRSSSATELCSPPMLAQVLEPKPDDRTLWSNRASWRRRFSTTLLFGGLRYAFSTPILSRF